MHDNVKCIRNDMSNNNLLIRVARTCTVTLMIIIVNLIHAPNPSVCATVQRKNQAKPPDHPAKPSGK